MELIWIIIIVFGLASLLLLVLGFWTNWEMTRKERESDQRKGNDGQDGTPPAKPR